jgi:hypothetical protein
MQSESAPTAVAILDFVNLDVASLDQANFGKDNGNDKGNKDQDEDEGTGSGTGAIFARFAMNFSSRSIISIFTGILMGICAGFWAGEASIGRVDDTVGAIDDGVVVSTVGGAKSSTTPITIDGLYDDDTTPTLFRKRSMTSVRWRWFRSAMESWRKLRNVQRR